jgi:hypothetical protein
MTSDSRLAPRTRSPKTTSRDSSASMASRKSGELRAGGAVEGAQRRVVSGEEAR